MNKFLMACMFLCFAVIFGCSATNSNSGGGSGGGGGKVLQSIQVTPGAPTVAAGLPVQLTATGTYSDNSTANLTNSASWTSSNTSIATVSTTGDVTSKATGSATITASLSGVSGNVTLTVTAPTITALTVTAPNSSIANGTTVQFTATGTFTDGSTQNATGLVQWTSSNTSVASINVNGAAGLAEGVSPGSSTITATSGSVAANASLTVTNATLTSIAVTPGDASIPLGTVQQFTATGMFSDGSTQNISGTVDWTSSNTSLVSITASGLATGKDLGSVTVTAASGSIEGSVSASVNADDLVSLAITPASPTIAATTSEQFSATGTFTNGSTRNLSSQVTWASDDTTVAKISGSGLAKALTAGSAGISATLGSVSTSTTLTVSGATLVSISVTPAGDTIAPGTDLSFTATGTFSDSSTQVITVDVTWGTSNSSVATVAVAGVATAVTAGNANISAALDSVTGSAALNVSSVTLESIAVTPTTSVLAPTSTLQYGAQGTYSDGSTQPITATVNWSSSDTDVATITSFGQATGQSAGTATITASQGSITSPPAVVLVESSALTQLTVSPATATVAEQTGTQFDAVGTFADGSTQNLTSSVTWSSAPPSVATVSVTAPTKGFATGLASGSATITALFAGESGSAALTVTNATLKSIAIAPTNPDIAAGSSEQFTATGTFSDGTTENLTSQVTWTSSNVSVATVSPSGLATTAATGTTTITATMLGVSGTTTLTVQ